MVLVDSSVWIEAMRREGDMTTKVALEQLLIEYEAAFCSPVRLEVMGGARRTERKRMGKYFSIIPYRPTTEEDWEQAMHYGWKLRDNGLTVPNNDLLIATIAIRARCRVYARDKHFVAMAKHLPLLLYKPGYGGKFNPN